MRGREHHVSVYLSDKEFRHLNHIKRTSKLATSSILRKAIMGMEVKAAPSISNSNLAREVNAIGNNINQIAKIANTTGIADIAWLAREFENLKKKVGDGIGDNQNLHDSG